MLEQLVPIVEIEPVWLERLGCDKIATNNQKKLTKLCSKGMELTTHKKSEN